MCPTRNRPKLAPIELDLAPALFFEEGLGRAELLLLGPQLEITRTAMLKSESDGGDSLLERPQQVLAEYRQQRKSSLLGRILRVARRLRETVDRVVVIGPSPLIAALQALVASLGHPHHNELSRSQRGERPRVFLLPAMPDNDALQGLFDMLPHNRLVRDLNERWGLVAIGGVDAGNRSEDQLELGLFSLFWDRLQQTTIAEEEARFAVVIGPARWDFMSHAESLGLERIVLPDAPFCGSIPPVPRRQSQADGLLDPGVLFGASLIGVDIVNVLMGAAAMNERFATRPIGDNPALDLAALRQLLSQGRGIDGICIESPSAALESLGRILSINGHANESLLIQWLPQRVRADRLRVKMPADDRDLRKRVAHSLPDLAADAAKQVRLARTAAGLPTAVIELPMVDEYALGQLVQMFLIAQTVEQLTAAKPQAVLNS